MTPLSQQALEAQQPPSRWDFVLEALVIAVLVFAPFVRFGSRDASSQETLLGICGALALCLAAKYLFRRDLNYVWSWAYLPIVLFLALIAFQLIPIPARLLAIISPHTLETKINLLQDLPAAPTLLRAPTITFYPLATRTDLRMVLAAATMFCVVVNAYRRPAQIKRLLLAISIIGVAVALLALWQNLTGTRLIYGIYPMGHINSGPFKNHSHFGQFMNLSMGAMLALFLVKTGETPHWGSQFGGAFDYRRGGDSILILALAVAILLSAGVILLSLARAATVAMVLAGGITALIWVIRYGKSNSGSVLAMLGFVALVLGLYVATGPVFNRLITLRHAAEDNGDRVQILKDLSVMWRQFPWVGTGLGTHQFIFPMFDHSTLLAMPVHAEDDYAELLEECGAVGLGLCLIFLAIIGVQYVRCIWARRQPIHLAALGLGCGLIAILIQTTSDFAQHVPAVACLTAVFCGLLVALARLDRPQAPDKSYGAKRPRPWASIPLRAGVALVTLAVFAWALPAAHVAAQAQQTWDESDAINTAISRRGWDHASVEDYIKVLRPATLAAQLQPEDVRVQYWLNDFRWRSISRNSVLPPSAIPFARRIVDELNTARGWCPTFAPNFALAGQIEFFALRLPAGAEHIRTGYRLDPNYPSSCSALAILDAEQGQWGESQAAAHRALALDRTLLTGLLRNYVRLNRSDQAYLLVAGDRDGLGTLAYMLQGDSTQLKLADRCRSESTGLLLAEAARPDAADAVLEAAGQYYADQGDQQKAIEYLRRAISRSGEYGAVDWRYNLAVALKKSGQFDAAAREARTCLLLRPRMREAEALLDSMDVRQLGE